jgi:LPXTG-motif cell wall-anchored protein
VFVRLSTATEQEDTHMRRVATFLLAAVLVLAVADAAGAAPTSSDPTTAARDGAAWLAARVNPQGFIPSSGDPNTPDYGSSTETVVALAAAGVGGTTIDALMTYLGAHVEANINHGGVDDPGAIANLILAAVATGANPTSFGVPATNLVTRLVATQQASGLFGTSDPTFDGAFRQGLSLLALDAAGVSNPAGVTWLEDQQCAGGLWTAFRADTNTPCSAVDPNTFSGPDTNSTALAVLGLHAQGALGPAADGVDALDAVRTADGGWSYLAASDQPTDADSTADVLDALRTVNGTVDTEGRAALFSLQLGCDAPVADRGAFAFQPGPGGSLDANLLASVQAVTAAAGVALPVVDATVSADVPTACVTSAPSTTTTTVAAAGSTTPTTASPTSGTVAPAATLPRTGSSSAALFGAGAIALVAGAALALGGRRRRL